MVQIRVNNKYTLIGEPLPDEIKYLEVIHFRAGESIPKNKVKMVKAWFNKLIDNCSCEWVSYNKCLMKVEDLNKFDLDSG